MNEPLDSPSIELPWQAASYSIRSSPPPLLETVKRRRRKLGPEQHRDSVRPGRVALPNTEERKFPAYQWEPLPRSTDRQTD